MLRNGLLGLNYRGFRHRPAGVEFVFQRIARQQSVSLPFCSQCVSPGRNPFSAPDDVLVTLRVFLLSASDGQDIRLDGVIGVECRSAVTPNRPRSGHIHRACIWVWPSANPRKPNTELRDFLGFALRKEPKPLKLKGWLGGLDSNQDSQIQEVVGGHVPKWVAKPLCSARNLIVLNFRPLFMPLSSPECSQCLKQLQINCTVRIIQLVS